MTAGILLVLASGVSAAVEGPIQKLDENMRPKGTRQNTQVAQVNEQLSAQADQQVVVPGAEKIVLLLRSTLNTLNDALRTGNYTVLRDVAAPGFRDANSAAQLAQIFSNLASQGVDLSVVSVISPQLSAPPAFDENKGLLRLRGHFSGPVQIDFEIMYQAVRGQWRLFGIWVDTSQPSAPDKKADPQK